MNWIIRITPVVLAVIGLSAAVGRSAEEPPFSGPVLSAPAPNDRNYSPWPPPEDVAEPPSPSAAAPRELPASAASPLKLAREYDHRSEQLEFVSREADRKTRHGFELAGRGAFFAARAEFIGALRMTAEGLDTEHKTDSHSRALTAALTAIREAEDFMPEGSRLESDIDLPLVVSTHVTPVLKTSAERVTSLTAMRCYLTFAQEQFAAAAEREVAGSMALRALGKLYDALAAKQGDSDSTAAPKAMVFFQAALLTYSENYMAANDLGVLLVRSGKLNAAKGIFEYSLTLSPQSATMHNLAAVHGRLGETALAARLQNEAERLEQIEISRRKYVQISGDTAIRWVDPQTFAQTAKGAPYLPSEKNYSPTQAPGQPVKPGRRTTEDGTVRTVETGHPATAKRMSWNPNTYKK